MPNLTPQEVARGCLLRIVAQPGRYDQGTWQTINLDQVDPNATGRIEVECATTGCVAGTAAMLAGDRGIAYADEATSRGGRRILQISRVITEHGKTIDIMRRGQQLLDLEEHESCWLFDGYRKLPEVVNALIELSEGRKLSKKLVADMTQEEIVRLKNYRVPPAVKRKSVPAAPSLPKVSAPHAAQ